ncbi:MAG: type 2 lantipeptide synthetase LanM [Novosphingobium sp.]|nr:type 2 lantipeptide synthetase LanM [Novosphingobium sp.]
MTGGDSPGRTRRTFRRRESEHFFQQLTARAASLDELLSFDFTVVGSQHDGADLAGTRLATWCKACTDGDWQSLARRLSYDKLRFDEVIPKLGCAVPTPRGRSQLWASDARWIFECLTPEAPGVYDFPEAQPFCHLFGDLVGACRSRRDARLPASFTDVFHASSLDGLDAELTRRLCDLCAPVLYSRFSRHISAAADTPDHSGEGDPYARFTHWMRSGGWFEIAESFPVLLRLVATTTAQWIGFTAELLTRTSTDLDRICERLAGGPRGERKVAEISSAISDPHHGGRTVRTLTLTDGFKVVYKPKDLRIDVVWAGLIRDLETGGAPFVLTAAAALACDGYGWSEFVAHSECNDEAAVRRFFERAGAFGALLYLLGGTDIHAENIIAAGEHPVPVDLEMLLQPVARVRDDLRPARRAQAAAEARLTNSVLAVGILPVLHVTADTRVVGLGGIDLATSAADQIRWENVNSAEMRPVRLRNEDAPSPNLPKVGGVPRTVNAFRKEFTGGFAAYGQFLIGRKDLLVSALRKMAGFPVRKVLKPTRFYYMLRSRLLNPASWRDGATWSAQTEFIFRIIDSGIAKPPLWELFRGERRSLLELNIPHFSFSGNGRSISDGNGVAERSESGDLIGDVLARIGEFDERALEQQVEVILLSLPADVSAEVGINQNARCSHIASEQLAVRLRESADEISEILSKHAIREGDGAAWIGLEPSADGVNFQLATLGNDLYSGNVGVAVFLAAHARCAGSADSRRLARAAMAQLLDTISSEHAPRFARLQGIGAGTGLGSVVYGLTTIADLLGDQQMLDGAIAASALITADLVRSDARYDALSGSAGAVLSLLRLFKTCGDDQILSKAIQVGEHLLHGNGSPVREKTLSTKLLAGMSHGAAGISYALSALEAACGQPEFGEAAARLLQLERAAFSHARMNWPDFRPTGDGGSVGWTCQWCHGGVGIGFSRLGMVNLRADRGEDLMAEIRDAAMGASRIPTYFDDSLCCGMLGSIEFLSRPVSDGETTAFQAMAYQRLKDLLSRRSETGSFRWRRGEDRHNLGFFRGIAGLGYYFLRHSAPSLPDVLLWE